MAGRTAKEEEVFNAVRKYNEDLMRSKESGPDVAPPLPLKKKTSKYTLASIVHVSLYVCMLNLKYTMYVQCVVEPPYGRHSRGSPHIRDSFVHFSMYM